jgi:hypothetical protein
MKPSQGGMMPGWLKWTLTGYGSAILPTNEMDPYTLDSLAQHDLLEIDEAAPP